MPGATTTGRPRGRPRKNQVAATSKPANANISTFARVSKHTATIGKDLGDKIAPVQVLEVKPLSADSRKRKAAKSPEPEEAIATPSQRQIKSLKKRRTAEATAPTPQTQQQIPSTPRRNTKKRALSPEPESPRSKLAGALFKRLKLEPSSPATTRNPSPLTVSTPATSVVPDSGDDSEPETEAPLPRELLDLVDLYAAFLKTLTVHYAHNGANSAVDLKAISPMITAAWGKRRISLGDIRRCVGIMDVDSSRNKSPFFLSDYGNKKICIEKHQQQIGSPIDEKSLAHVFEQNLRGIWSTLKPATSEMNTFVLGLPKTAILACESAAKISPMLAKGQRTLQELKQGIALKKENQPKAPVAATPAVPLNADGTKMSLLDRIRQKEIQLAASGGGPTPQELERRAALLRADDIAAVIAMLSKSTAMGQKRVSFTMPNLLQKLKDSLRLPISREEGAACIRLLAKEVAPQWLKIITIGSKENIVVMPDLAPSKAAIQERVKALST